MRAWNIYRRGRWINCVYYERHITAAEVKWGLVNHDGYPPDIVVK